MTQFLSTLDKYKLTATLIKTVTGVIGGSLILEQNHPYITLSILAVGAAANEFVVFLQNKQNKPNGQI